MVPTFNTFIYNVHNTVQIQKGGEMIVRFVAFWTASSLPIISSYQMSTTVYWTTNNNLKFNEVFQYVHEYLCVYKESTIVRLTKLFANEYIQEKPQNSEEN